MVRTLCLNAVALSSDPALTFGLDLLLVVNSTTICEIANWLPPASWAS